MSSSVKVTFRMSGSGYSARAGRGKKSTTASSTNQPSCACRRAAAKYLRCNEDRVSLSPEPSAFGSMGECVATEIPVPAGDIELSPAEFNALAYVAASGVGEQVDIFSPELARHLAAIEKACPELLTLQTNPPADHVGTKPYYRAIVTAAGHAWLAATSGSSLPAPGSTLK